VALAFLPLAWLLITRVLYPIRLPEIAGGKALFEREFRELGPMNCGERMTLAVFAVTAAAWITRPLLVDLSVGPAAWQPFAGLSDGGIAIVAALVLFLLPADGRDTPAGRRATGSGSGRVMDWETAERLPWGVLILFGGGLSLAAAVQANGVAEFLGAQASVLQGMPMVVLVLCVTTGVIFLTELTSNTATTATLVPILAGLASGLAVPPEALIIPATLAASCAFMLPVGTPPNAIVFGSGYVTIPQMARAGIWLNLIGIVLITALMYAIVLPLLAAS
jgi:sodium-dependent dicarboxylate transporter 2/3/5